MGRQSWTCIVPLYSSERWQTGHDSVLISATDSQSGYTRFNSRQDPTCPGLTMPSIHLVRSVNWYQLRLGVKCYMYGHWVVSVRLLLARFRLCSWSVSCFKTSSGHFWYKSHYRKTRTLNFEMYPVSNLIKLRLKMYCYDWRWLHHNTLNCRSSHRACESDKKCDLLKEKLK